MKSLADILLYDVLFVDAMNLCARSYHGLRGLTYRGKSTAMEYGVIRFVLDWRKRNNGIQIIFIWEGQNSWRKEKYPIYKANRKNNQKNSDREDFINSLSRVKECLSVMGVEQQWTPTLEADDTVWASLKVWEGHKQLFASTDWDWWPLSRHGDILYNRDILSADDLKSKFVKKYKCVPIDLDQLYLFKILTGDASDNISGIPRFPKKLAAEVCNLPGVNLDTLVSALLMDLGKSTWANSVKSYKWLLERNQELVMPRVPDKIDVVTVPGDFAIDKFKTILLDAGMVDLYERFSKQRGCYGFEREDTI